MCLEHKLAYLTLWADRIDKLCRAGQKYMFIGKHISKHNILKYNLRIYAEIGKNFVDAVANIATAVGHGGCTC